MIKTKLAWSWSGWSRETASGRKLDYWLSIGKTTSRSATALYVVAGPFYFATGWDRPIVRMAIHGLLFGIACNSFAAGRWVNIVFLAFWAWEMAVLVRDHEAETEPV